eukprot:TRINITY_DN105651_c0_g1_i1.p1 TRINITY_DN105651_c0_g1~~TRINITY_DN105651_c0_g1_i1.p1  ORF type:complete len:383 (+),score=20.53 TRINITY_DN105651_c0_g1_i1:79-1227(+)
MICWHLILVSFLSNQLALANRKARYIFVGVGAHSSDLAWIDTQRKLHGHRYTPIFFNPHPGVGNLSELVRSRGGFFYPYAAWIADGISMPFHLTLDPFHQGGFDGLQGTNVRHRASIMITTVDIARILSKHTTPSDIVVMRMDVEGSEYELLRHLLLKGLLCRLRRLYVETHAMHHPNLTSFRAFDVVLPWLLSPCGTEVYVDSNYHNSAESRLIWVKDDGACRQCPVLYRTIPGVGTECPPSALPHCFDSEFSCERCCSHAHGPRGDSACWSRAAKGKDSLLLPSGGRAYPIPDAVLASMMHAQRWNKSKEQIQRLAGEKAGRLPIFSYEMCCAGMLGQIMPPLVGATLHHGEDETYNALNPRYSRAVRPPDRLASAIRTY